MERASNNCCGSRASSLRPLFCCADLHLCLQLSAPRPLGRRAKGATMIIPDAELIKSSNPKRFKRRIEELNRRILLNPYSDRFEEGVLEYDEDDEEYDELDELLTPAPDAPEAPKLFVRRGLDWFVYSLMSILGCAVVVHVAMTGSI